MLTTTLFRLAILTASTNAISLPLVAHSARAIDIKAGPNPQTLTLPSSGLPVPGVNLTLKYVALGIGTQNYSCVAIPISSSSAATSTPTTSSQIPSLTATSIGARAKLHDATALLQRSTTNLTLVLPSLTCLADATDYGLGLPLLGHHFFTANLTPTFDLHHVGDYLSAVKSGDVAAPAGSCSGRNGQGAVDWLRLVDNGDGKSVGVEEVFRVEVAGGKSTGCEGLEEGEVVVSDYAAEYWFYG